MPLFREAQLRPLQPVLGGLFLLGELACYTFVDRSSFQRLVTNL
jgi:hypothetical protein